MNPFDFCDKLYKDASGNIVLQNAKGLYDYDAICAWAEAHPDQLSDAPEPTSEEKIAAIKVQLASLDVIIPRALEDLYNATGQTPYASVQVVIDQKIELRKQIDNLTSTD